MSIIGPVLSECIEELSDPLWATRTHGRISTYNAGCRGALCTKSNRDAQRKIRHAAHPGEPDTRTRQEQARDKLLEAVQYEHEKDRAKQSV